MNESGNAEHKEAAKKSYEKYIFDAYNSAMEAFEKEDYVTFDE